MFAIAVDLQDITRTVDPVVWAIGLTREPAIAFIDLEGTQQNRSLYYKANYSSDDDLVRAHARDNSNTSDLQTTTPRCLFSWAISLAPCPGPMT